RDLRFEGGLGRKEEVADVGAGEVDLGADLVEEAEAFETRFADAGFVFADAVEGDERSGRGGDEADHEAPATRPDDLPERSPALRTGVLGRDESAHFFLLFQCNQMIRSTNPVGTGLRPSAQGGMKEDWRNPMKRTREMVIVAIATLAIAGAGCAKKK